MNQLRPLGCCLLILAVGACSGGAGDTEARCKAGFEQLDLGNFDAARGHFEAALEREPGYSGALYGMGQVHAADERLQKAREYLTKAIAADPDFAHAYLSRGFIQGMLEGPAAAKADAEKAFELMPALRTPSRDNEVKQPWRRHGRAAPGR